MNTLFLTLLLPFLYKMFTMLRKRSHQKWHDKYHTGGYQWLDECNQVISKDFRELKCQLCTTHSWDSWMDDKCLCERCRNIRCLEEDLFIVKVKTQHEYQVPRYILRNVERHGRMYARKETLSGDFVKETYLGEAYGKISSPR